MLGNNVIWFDNKGRGIDGNSFDFKVTPSTATVTARTDDYWFPAGAGGGGLPRVLKERDRSGNTVLTVNCPVNNSTSQREIYIHLSHSITPGVTKKIKLIQPTIHKYLSGQTKSQFRRVDADEFMIAALLPVQRFKKASSKEVWSDSRGMI